MEPGLRLSFIIFFITIDDSFNNLKQILGNSHQKEHAIDEIQELKIRANSFINFDSEFIKLAFELKYTLEMLI